MVGVVKGSEEKRLLDVRTPTPVAGKKKTDMATNMQSEKNIPPGRNN